MTAGIPPPNRAALLGVYWEYRGVQTNKEYPLCLVLYSFVRLVFFGDQRLACRGSFLVAAEQGHGSRICGGSAFPNAYSGNTSLGRSKSEDRWMPRLVTRISGTSLCRLPGHDNI